jgi:hypothetical protein
MGRRQAHCHHPLPPRDASAGDGRGPLGHGDAVLPTDYRYVAVAATAPRRHAEVFLRWVAQDVGLDPRTRSRDPAVVYLRRLTWLVLRWWGYSLPQIARLYGYDHTTVLYGLQCLGAQPYAHQHATLMMTRFTDAHAGPPHR